MYSIAEGVYAAINVHHEHGKIVKGARGRYLYTNAEKEYKHSVPDPTEEKQRGQ